MKYVNCMKFALSIVTLIFGFFFHASLLVHVQWRDDVEKLQNPSPHVLCRKIAMDHVKNNHSHDDADCEEIFRGNLTEICKWSQYHEKSMPDEQFAKQFTNCSWKMKNRYHEYANSDLEEQFPLAFSISIHGNVEQMERLLRLIYWPQNLYCIHVDKRASDFVHEAVNQISSCFPNVFVTKSENVYWAGFGVLQSVLNCMSDTLTLFPDHNWRYFLNLAGQDFPLKTNLELVKILHFLNGSNDVELNYELQFSRYWFSHRIVTDPSGRAVTHMPDYRKSKLPIPHGLKIYKGNLAATLSKSFVKFVLQSSVSVNFTSWLSDTDTADEHLWATMNHNRIPPFMEMAPGGYPGHCHDSNRQKSWISRFVRWRNEQLDCHGKYVRDVCVLGVGDLPTLINRSELFVNKFYRSYQSKAFQCMERWFMEKIDNNRSNIDAKLYQSLDAVKYQNYIVNQNDSDGCPTYMMTSGKSEKYEVPAPLRKYIKGSIIAQSRA